jgi:hypothetical protein
MKHKKSFRTDLIYFGCANKHEVIFDESDIDFNQFSSNPLLGELNHPNRAEIDLTRVSHIIENIKVEHDILYGDIKVLETSHGHTLDKLLDSNSVVFRPRVTIESTFDGTITFYKIHTFDAVDKREDCFEAYRFRKKKILKIINKLKNRNL